MKKYILCAIGLTAFNVAVYANTPTTTTNSFFNQIAVETDGSFKTAEGVKGRIVCEKQKMQELLTQSPEKEDEIAKCISVESFDITQDVDGKPVRVVFDGAFNYPRFTKKTTFQIIDAGNSIAQMYNSATQSTLDTKQAKDLEHYIFKTAKITFHDDNDTITFETLNGSNLPISELTVRAKNISGLIEAGYNFSKTQQPTLLINHLKNIEITNLSGYTSQQKKDSQFSGSINLLLAKIANDSSLSLYNFNEKNVINVKSIENGLRFDIAYPVTETKLLSFDLLVKSSALKQIQEQLLQADNINDYMGIFMSLSMGLINPVPQEIIIQDLTLTDLQGINILETKEVTINPTTQTANGEIRFINTPTDYISVKLNGDTVILTDSQGKTEQLSFNQFTQKAEEFWNTPRAVTFKNAFWSEIEKLRQTEPKTSVSHFYEGMLRGYENALLRYQANEIIDTAIKLASLSYAQNQTSLAKTGQPANMNDMTLEKYGLVSNAIGNTLPNGGSLEITAINADNVTMNIVFPTDDICIAGKRIMEDSSLSCDGPILKNVTFRQS